MLCLSPLSVPFPSSSARYFSCLSLIANFKTVLDTSSILYEHLITFFDITASMAVFSGRPTLRTLLPTILAIFSLTLFFSGYLLYEHLPYETKAFLLRETQLTSCNLDKINSTAATCRASHNETTSIPNIVHLVYILRDADEGNFPIQFSHFLSIYAIYYRWRPDAIYLHTNAATDGPAVMRAKDGSMGKWSKMFFEIPGLVINTVSEPTRADNGVAIDTMEHKSDFARVKAVHDFGGIYIDLDVHALRDMQPLRESGYGSVLGRQVDGNINSGTFMSVKGGKMISMWLERMHQVYDGKWVTHSNLAVTHVGHELASTDPCEALILGRNAFAPGGWTAEDNEWLYDDHEETRSNIERLSQGDDLPEFAERDSTTDLGLTESDEDDSWAFDWSCTFLLHAFNLKKPRHGVKHNGISPKYVLERRSNFARAVYPVVKDMYEKGIVMMDEDE